MSRKITLAPGEFYHIYNRGTEKRKVFLNRRDYHRFLSLLYLANGGLPIDIKQQGSTLSELLVQDRGKKIVDVCAYCLMPNHFHLIIKEIEEGGISKFMQKLMTAYTMYFNKRQERSGALFQGKFKIKHATDDRYLNYLIAYLHLNPIELFEHRWKEDGIHDREKAKQFLDSFHYSSFLDYSGLDRLEKVILSLEVLPLYVSTPRDFHSSITQWLDNSAQKI